MLGLKLLRSFTALTPAIRSFLFSPSKADLSGVRPPRVDTLAAFWGALVGRGPVTLSPPRIGAGAQVLAPVMQRATIAAPFLTDPDTIYAPAVLRGARSLLPGLLTDPDAFYGALVQTGPHTLAPGLLTDPDTIFAPTVTARSNTIAPPLLTDADTVFAPTVTSSTGLYPPLVPNSNSIKNPNVGRGARTLTASLLASTTTFYAPNVGRGARQLTAPLVTDADSFFAPTVSQSAASAANLIPTGTNLQASGWGDYSNVGSVTRGNGFFSFGPGGNGQKVEYFIAGITGPYTLVADIAPRTGAGQLKMSVHDAYGDQDYTIPGLTAGQTAHISHTFDAHGDTYTSFGFKLDDGVGGTWDLTGLWVFQGSADLSGNTGSPTAPNAPTLTVLPGDTQNRISWSDSSTGVTKHKLYRSTTSGFTPGPANFLGEITTASPYYDLGLVNGTTYYYALTSLNASNQESSFSSIVSGQPAAPATNLVPTGANFTAAGWGQYSEGGSIYRDNGYFGFEVGGLQKIEYYLTGLAAGQYTVVTDVTPNAGAGQLILTLRDNNSDVDYAVTGLVTGSPTHVVHTFTVTGLTDVSFGFKNQDGVGGVWGATTFGIYPGAVDPTVSAPGSGTTTTYATLNPADKTATATLSAGNLTLTSTAATGTQSAARSTIAVTQKTCVEFSFGSGLNDVQSIGVVSSTFSLSSGNGPQALYWNSDGTYGGGGVTVPYSGAMGGGGPNTKARLAIDPTSTPKQAWWSINGGNWNGNASANPETGVGGYSLAGMSEIFILLAIWENGGSASVNFGATAFSTAAPAGYGPLSSTTTNVPSTQTLTVPFVPSTTSFRSVGVGAAPAIGTPISPVLLAAAGQPTLDPRTYDTDATIKTGATAGTFIRSFAYAPLALGETITSISPNDGKVVRDSSNRQLRCGSTPTTSGTTIYTLGRSGGGSFTFALTAVPGALKSTYGRDRNWWTRNYRRWLGISSPALSPHGAYDNSLSNQYVEAINFEIGAPNFRGLRFFTAPLCTSQTTIEAAATGSMDSLWQASFAKIFANDEGGGLGHQPIIYVRPGCEANLYTWAWSAIRNGQTSRDAYKAAFARYADAIRAYDTLGRVKLVFCPSASLNTDSAEQFMPDPSKFDVLGTDLYHEPLFGYSEDPATALTQAINCTNGPAWVTQRANELGKGKCIPELGTNTEGMGLWIKGIHDYCDTNDYLYVTWWESQGAYQSELAFGYDEGLQIGDQVPGTPYGDNAAKQGNMPRNGAMYRHVANPEMYPENPLSRPAPPTVAAVPRSGSVDLYLTPGVAGTAGATLDYVLYMDSAPGVAITLTGGKFTVSPVANDEPHVYSVAARNTAGIGFPSLKQTVSASVDATVPAVHFGANGEANASSLAGLNGAGTTPISVEIVFSPSASDLVESGDIRNLFGIWGTTGYLTSFIFGLNGTSSAVWLQNHDNSGHDGCAIFDIPTPLVAGHAYKLTATMNPTTGIWTASIGPASGSLTALTKTNGFGSLTTQTGYASPDPSLGNLPPRLMMGDSVMGLRQFHGSIRSVKASLGATEVVNTTATSSALTDTHGLTWSLAGGAIVA